MLRVAILAAIVACGDGRTLESDATSQVDVGDRGIVHVKVTGFVEKAGLHVYFQERDSSLSLSTRTDGDGEASGRLGPDGFVTLVSGRDSTLTLWTYTGVQPGDELEFFEPDADKLQAPVESVSIFAMEAGAPPFILRSSCSMAAMQIVDPLPVAMPIPLCGPRVDFLLERGQIYRYVRDVNMLVPPRRVDFVGQFVELDTSTVRVSAVPAASVIVTQALLGQGFPLATTSSDRFVTNGTFEAVLGLPLPADATMLTQIDVFNDPFAQHIVDWRPSTTTLEVAYDEITLAPATQAPRYDATTTSIVWTEGSGTPGDLVRATMHWLDENHARTRSWVVIGPRDDEPVLHVPLLPIPDLVPTIEVPQSVESFIVGDHLEWVRRHLHGNWLAQGRAWPTDGESGRVVWRSL